MFLLFWIGSFWREDHGPDQDLPPAATVPAGPAAPRLAPLAIAPAAPFATAWTPGFPAPAAQLRQYVQQGATPVGLVLQYYQAAPGVKLISSMNRIVAPQDPLWSVVGSSERTVVAGTRSVALRETLLSGPGGRIAVWHWYWIGGDSTGNPVKGKLLQVRQRLLNGKGDGAAVFAYAPYEDHPDGARLALQGFIAQQLPAIDAALAQQGK
jgi:EpsI family protein